jgi:hypothetical protein
VPSCSGDSNPSARSCVPTTGSLHWAPNSATDGARAPFVPASIHSSPAAVHSVQSSKTSQKERTTLAVSVGSSW